MTTGKSSVILLLLLLLLIIIIIIITDYIIIIIAVETGRFQHISSPAPVRSEYRKISESTGKAREAGFLFQRCSVLVQRFNAILLHDSLPAYDCTD